MLAIDGLIFYRVLNIKLLKINSLKPFDIIRSVNSKGEKMKKEQQENTPEKTKETESTQTEVDKLIKNHVYVSIGIGLVPVPFLDFVGVTGVELNLLRKLAQVYNVPFSKDMVKNLIGALIGGAFPASVGARITGSMTKAVPVMGYIAGALGSSVISGASTYAIGKVFNRHFSEGGTFLSFDIEEARAYYEEMFKEGQNVAAEMKKKA